MLAILHVPNVPPTDRLTRTLEIVFVRLGIMKKIMEIVVLAHNSVVNAHLCKIAQNAKKG